MTSRLAAMNALRRLLALSLLLTACADAPSPDAPAEASATDALTYEGIDVSSYQGAVDWAAVAADSVAFAYAKATEGLTIVDDTFAANWQGMAGAGLARGAYHFFVPTDGARAQAQFFLTHAPPTPGALAPMLDVEEDGGLAAAALQDSVKAWMDVVEAAWGVRPLLYSDLSFARQYLAEGLGDYPLWVADYQAAPTMPLGDWTAWTIWQYADTQTIDGIDGAVDQDRFRGTAAQWEALHAPAAR